MSQLKNAAWFYLGHSIKDPGYFEQLISWCNRNNIVKLLLKINPTDVYNENSGAYSRKEIIKEFIDKCQNADIEVHGMISTLLNRTENREKLMLQGRDNFCVDYHGISNWDEPIGGRGFLYDPTSEDVKASLAEFCYDILNTYDKLSGIQLDFIRYFYYDSILDINTKNAGHFIHFLNKGNSIKLKMENGSQITYFVEKVKNSYIDPPIGDKLVLRRRAYYCFCDRCLERFQENSNIIIPDNLKTTNEKAKWILDNHADIWDSFHAKTITDLIRHIRTKVKSLNDDLQLSATIWYNSPYGNELKNEPFTPMSEYKYFGQEWWKWVEEGLVDFLCPMDYWLSPDNYKKVVIDQIKRLKNKIPVFFGLLRAKEYDISVEKLNVYKSIVEDVKGINMKGICYFHYDTWKDII